MTTRAVAGRPRFIRRNRAHLDFGLNALIRSLVLSGCRCETLRLTRMRIGVRTPNHGDKEQKDWHQPNEPAAHLWNIGPPAHVAKRVFAIAVVVAT